MPPISSLLSTRSGSSGSERAKDSRRRVSAAARVAPSIALLRCIITSRRGPLRRRSARSMPPTTTASMLLKSCAMPPVSWPTASIFWTWRSWASAASRSLGLGLQRLVGLPQLLRALAHRLLERLGALGLALGLAAGGGVLAKRLDGDDAEEDRAEPDDDAEPARDNR